MQVVSGAGCGSHRENTNDGKLRNAEAKKGHLELSARTTPHSRCLAKGGCTDELAAGGAERRLAESHGRGGGSGNLKSRRRCGHRHSKDDRKLAHCFCMKHVLPSQMTCPRSKFLSISDT
jgi:hypothetical protein